MSGSLVVVLAAIIGNVSTASEAPSKMWTAEELVAANARVKGGLEKIKAIKSIRYRGRYQQQGFSARVAGEAKAPDRLRQTFTVQGMTEVSAYDGSVGWKISPFEGRKDPELLGEDAMRGMVEDADFYGHLVDWKEKGSALEYLGHDAVDGDDALRLKLTLKNGDCFYYYFDPDTLLEIRVETVRVIRGVLHEGLTDMGSYKKVNGVYFPFSFENGSKGDGGNRSKVTIESMDANVEVPDADFAMPAAPAGKKS